MLTGFMLQMCGFATIDRGGWIGINTLVVLLAVTIAALVYAVGNFLPTEKRERLRGAVRYEIIEALISLAIIITLILFASFTCSAGGALVGQKGYSDVFNAADVYVGGLLFTNGMSVMSNIYTVSVQYEVISSFFEYVSAQSWGKLKFNQIKITAEIEITPELSVPIQGSFFFIRIARLFDTFYGILLDGSFGGLFIMYLLLKIIEACALTIVVPIAILMRSLSFMGPQLRKTSNLFLAMGIGFYFVLPLMIALNSYVAGCLNISTGVALAACNYPYFSAYLQGYTIPSVATSLFTTGASYQIDSSMLPGFAQGGVSLPLSFYSAAFPSLGQFISTMVSGPQLALRYGSQIAAYLFLAIVLLGLDLGVTAGFIVGISKGLDSIGGENLFGGGPFLGG